MDDQRTFGFSGDDAASSPPAFAEAAARVRCCERTIRRAIDSGALRARTVRAVAGTRGGFRISPGCSNAWVLAYRRTLRSALLSWDGETDPQPPPHPKDGQPRLGDDWSVKGLREPQPRVVRPDAVLEIRPNDASHAADTHAFLIEYDRTRRVDRNYGKFRRYDAFLNWWWRHSQLGAHHQSPPFVIFICQDGLQRRQFVASADRELTGHRWHPTADPHQFEYDGRRHVLFVLERDLDAGSRDAWRVPTPPAGHRNRTSGVRRVQLPGG